MKVLQILPELNSGGVERGTLEIARALVAARHEALVVSNGGRLVTELEGLGARHIELPVHKKRLSSLRQVGALRKLFEHERPDIVHARSRAPAWLAWLAWRGMNQATRPRFVTTVHGFYSVNFYSGVMTRGEHVIAVSESVKAYVLSNYRRVDAGRLTVIHRGVDPALYPRGHAPGAEWHAAWRAEHPELEGKVVLLMPGRLTRWKGQEDFLRILSKLSASGMPVHGLLAGETHPKKREYEAELRALAAELGVGSRVSFLGHRGDLREIMAVSDVVFSLSNEPEAFGRVSLEAMALGKPVVGYEHGGVAEQLRAMFPEGLTAVGDVEAAIARVRDLLARGVRPGVVRDEFTLARMCAATLGVYETVLRGPRG